mgnify:CR=1 FL=1
MINFWLIIGIFILFAAGVFLLSLRQNLDSAPQKGRRKQLNWALHEQRLATLDQLELPSEIAVKAENESKRNLLNDLSTDNDQDLKAGGEKTYWAAFVLACVLAVVGYLQTGRPDLLSNPPVDFGAEGRRNVSILVRKLESNPNDLESWIMLAQALEHLGKSDEARKAYEFALKLAPNNLMIQAAYAQTLATLNQGSMDGKPTEIIQNILKSDRANKPALWLAGLGAAEHQDFTQTLTYWSQLLALLQEGTDEYKELKEAIEEIKEAKKQQSETTSQTLLTADVQLLKGIATSLPPETVVFVSLKAKDEQGMPLSAARLRLSDLPKKIELNDQMMQQTGRSIQKGQKLILTARISRTGTPKEAPGDLYGSKELVWTGEPRKLSVIIDREVGADAKK